MYIIAKTGNFPVSVTVSGKLVVLILIYFVAFISYVF